MDEKKASESKADVGANFFSKMFSINASGNGLTVCLVVVVFAMVVLAYIGATTGSSVVYFPIGLLCAVAAQLARGLINTFDKDE